MKAQYWTLINNNLYPSTIGNNVGVGTSIATSVFTVNTPGATGSGIRVQKGGVAGAGTQTSFLGDGGSASAYGVLQLFALGTMTTQIYAGGNSYFNSTGNLGVGTTTPIAKFHVYNGSVLYSGTTGSTPTTGAGTRMMWIPALSAFRAGVVTGTQWNTIGVSSTAFGYNTTASGDVSTAFGSNTTASGAGSVAFGSYNIASGVSSLVNGALSVASGDYSTAFAWGSTAQSFASFVVGRYNKVSGTPTSWVDTDPLFVIGNGGSDITKNNAITVLKNGKTLIGNPSLGGLSDTPDGYLLFVRQGILTEKVKVAIYNTAYWADYVFDEKYELKSIKELESYVTTNKHLPNVPSAEEVVKEGIDMATMDAKLLEKIEELSLYIIQQNKRIEALEKNVQDK